MNKQPNLNIKNDDVVFHRRDRKNIGIPDVRLDRQLNATSSEKVPTELRMFGRHFRNKKLLTAENGPARDCITLSIVHIYCCELKTVFELNVSK